MLPSRRTTHEQQQQQRTQLAHASHTGCTTRLQLLRAAGAWRSFVLIVADCGGAGLDGSWPYDSLLPQLFPASLRCAGMQLIRAA